MKKFLSTILISLVFSDFTLAEVVLDNNVQSLKPNYSKKIVKKKDSLIVKDEKLVTDLITAQQKKDLEDIENIWNATVENNNLLKFALKKIASPDAQKRVHSSIMAKTLSALVSGAAFVPTVFGADAMIQSASFATGRIASNLVNKKNMPQLNTLTDTELIEVASLIEELQDEIISGYYNYKASLNQIKETREKLFLYNKNYYNAIQKNNDIEIIISYSMYDQMQVQEVEQINIAKKNYVRLERLAGKKAMSKLNLVQYAIKNELYDPSVIKNEVNNEKN